MTPLETLLGGVVISVASGLLGARVGSWNKVSVDTCSERRLACNRIIENELKSLRDTLEKIWKKLENGN